MSGRVRGRMERGVAAFLGIPYAAPPFGTLRMRPPTPPVRWDGVRDALVFGRTCPQGADSDPLFPEVVNPGEDCLNLNVWTPDPGASGLPVLVWIHGGMFAKGSGAGYRGTSFARDGVVCVTINYRLGAEGFLYVEDGTPNAGLLDQVAALEWVQRNIAAFGGDPGRVTVAGQSAGAMSVVTLMATPRARGLFHQGIAQSGAVTETLTPESAAASASTLAASLGTTPRRLVLGEVSPERLAEAASALIKQNRAADPTTWASLPFAPVVDGDVLPRHPLDALDGDVRLLIGGNRDDTRIGLVPTGMIDLIDGGALTAVAGALGAAVEPYRANRPQASSGELLAAVTTDCFIRVPAIRVAEKLSDSWMYRFDHGSPSFGGRLGAAHGVEIPFVFDLLGQESSRALIGDEPSQAVADTTHGAWVRFAVSGDPGWPRYDLARRSTALIDEQITVVGDPDGAEREAWAGRG